MTDTLLVPAPEPDFSDRQLTPQQHLVINLLATGATITEAALGTGVHRNTIHHWVRTLPAFTLEMAAATREQTLLVRERAVSLIPKAFEVIGTILHNTEASLSLKLRAAAMVLKMAAEPPATVPRSEAPCFEQILSDRLNMTNQEFAQNCTIVTTNPIENVQTVRKSHEPGRNTVCPCGSGLKFKRCCSAASAPAASSSTA